MKVSAFIENTVFSKGLEAEHGLSLLLETDGEQLLMDCGQTDAFLRNIRRMHRSLADIACTVISHGHYDHTGGLSKMLELAPEMPVYLSQYALDPKFRAGNYVGQPKSNLGGKYRIVDEPTVQITENVFILSEIERYFPVDTAIAGFATVRNGTEQDDDFADEIAIAVKYSGGLAVISGCSHSGATNIIETAQQRMQMPVTAFIGGLHLRDKIEGAQFDHIVQYFNNSSLRHIVTGHCTGIHSFADLRHLCSARVEYLSTGTTVEII